jgi:hypothetical protein
MALLLPDVTLLDPGAQITTLVPSLSSLCLLCVFSFVWLWAVWCLPAVCLAGCCRLAISEAQQVQLPFSSVLLLLLLPLQSASTMILLHAGANLA